MVGQEWAGGEMGRMILKRRLALFFSDTQTEDKKLKADGAAKRDSKELPIYLLSSTWCHRIPADTPSSCCTIGVSFEEHIDDVACAGDVVWYGGAAGLRQEGRPVPIRDFQIVEDTVGMGLDIECGELYNQLHSLIRLYCLCLHVAARIIVRVVW